MVMKVTQCSSNWRPLIKTYRVQFQRKKERKKEKESKSSHHFLYSHGRRSAFAFTIRPSHFACDYDLQSFVFLLLFSLSILSVPFLSFLFLFLTCIKSCTLSISLCQFRSPLLSFHIFSLLYFI